MSPSPANLDRCASVPKLELHFVADNHPWLAKVRLVHPEIRSMVATSYPTDFRSTAGVKGLCNVLLTAVKYQLEGVTDPTTTCFCVKDEPIGLKALWEACLPKSSSTWAKRIFGVARDVDPILRRIIEPKGKGRQRGHKNDTRTVELNREFLPPAAIHVYVQATPLDTAGAVADLIERLNAPPNRPVKRDVAQADGVGGGLRSFKQVESEEFQRSRANLFPRIGRACESSDLLLSWAEFLPCSLEPEDFMRGHHESMYREVLPSPPGWREVVDWYNDFGNARRNRLEGECQREARNWMFIHMMFQSDLERIASNDPEYKCCSNVVKQQCFGHLAALVRNKHMNLKLGFVPTHKERRLRRPRWNRWHKGHDSVVAIEAKSALLLCFARDRAWKLREVDPDAAPSAGEWLRAVQDVAVFEEPKVLALLARLKDQCAIEADTGDL